jgi:hypothetical protein
MARTKRLLVAGFVVLMVMLACAARAWAQPVDPPGVAIEAGEVPEILEFLGFVASPGGMLILGALISVALERWPWYVMISEDWLKRAIAIAVTAVLAMIAYVLTVYVPPAFWASLAPYWAILAAAVFAVAGNQGWFQSFVRGARPVAITERRWTVLGGEPETA